MVVKKFTKPAITVEAIQFEYSTQGIADMDSFCGVGRVINYNKNRLDEVVGQCVVLPNSLSNNLYSTVHDGRVCKEGDWVVKFPSTSSLQELAVYTNKAFADLFIPE